MEAAAPPLSKTNYPQGATSGLMATLVVFSTCVLLLWAPLPAASNREWSAALLCCWSFLNLGLLFASQITKRPEQQSSFRWALLALISAPSWAAAQMYFGLSKNPQATLEQLMLGGAFCANFYIVTTLFTSRDRIKLLLYVLMLSATAQAFYGSIMVLSQFEWSLVNQKLHYLGSATGTFINRNHLAGYLEIGLGAAIALLFSSRGATKLSLLHLLDWVTGPKALIRVAMIIMVVGLVMTRSRMGNIAFFSSLLTFGALFILFHQENRLRNSLVLASIILIDVLIVSQYFGLENLKDRITATQFETQLLEDGSIKSETEIRDDIAKITWQEGRPFWATGIGAGAYEKWFIQHKPQKTQAHWDHAHNDYLQFLTEYGAPVFILLLALCAYALVNSALNMATSKSKFYSGVSFGLGISLLSIAIHSAADFNLQIPSNALSFCVVLALVYTATSKAREIKRKTD